jgi:hypothetical protein
MIFDCGFWINAHRVVRVPGREFAPTREHEAAGDITSPAVCIGVVTAFLRAPANERIAGARFYNRQRRKQSSSLHANSVKQGDYTIISNTCPV